MIPGLLLELLLAGLAGAISHELAHWVVWKVTGRQPALDLWGLTVRPRAGGRKLRRGDRVAAAAPYVVGAGCFLAAAALGSMPLLMFAIFMIQIPSPEDVAAVKGDVEWAIRA